MSVLSSSTTMTNLGLYSAYNPLVFSVNASTATEVVFCDVYINSVYYKTISSTTPDRNTTIHTIDIQSIVQEYLVTPPYLGIYFTGMYFFAATANGVPNKPFAWVQCKFRGSTISGGLLTPDGPVPVQGTIDTLPQAGGGLAGITFYVMNAALQHEDNVSLEQVLKYYRTIPILIGSLAPNQNDRIYALTRAKRYTFYMNDYALFPFIVCNNGFSGSSPGSPSSANVQLRVWGFDKNGGSALYTTSLNATITHNDIYAMPVGIPTLKLLNPAIPFETFDFYFAYLFNVTANKALLYTPKIYVKPACNDRRRIWFINGFGMYDYMTFADYEESLITSSGTKEKTEIMLVNTEKFKGGRDRFNVRSNEVCTAIGTILEEEIELYKELLDSPKAMLEFPGYTPNPILSGTQIIYPQLISIRMMDGEFSIKKVDNRYEYDVAVQYEMGNENIKQRI